MRSPLRSDAGQGFVAYAMILMLVAIVVVLALALTGDTIGNMYSTLKNNILFA